MINRTIASLRRVLTAFRDRIDGFEADYLAELKKADEGLDAEKYSHNYIEMYKSGEKARIDEKYKGMIERERKSAEGVANAYLRKIGSEIEGYVSAQPRPEFLNSLQIYISLGMRFTDAELQTMGREAQNYAERRILNAFFSSQMEPVKPVNEDLKKLMEGAGYTEGTMLQNVPDGQPNVSTVTADLVRQPYQIDIPDVTELRKEYGILKDGAKDLLENYGGQHGKLAPFSRNQVQDSYSCVCDYVVRNPQYFQNFETFTQPIQDEFDERPLTNQEADMLDVLVNSDYEFVQKERVEEISKSSPELAELFRKSPRYAEYVPVEE